MDYIFSNAVTLNKPLIIHPDKFKQGYNYPIEDLIDKRPGGGGNLEISYLSYTHTIRIFRELFPGYSAECQVNPLTGSYLFEEPQNRGFYMKSYVHNGEHCSALYYYGVLDTSMSPIFQGQATTYRDKKTGKTEVRKYLDVSGKYVPVPALNTQVLNKSYYRAICKAIAFTTGIGLKLWTGDDLTDPSSDENAPVPMSKMSRIIDKVQALSQEYTELTGLVYEGLNINGTEEELIYAGRQLKKLIQQAKESSIEDTVSSLNPLSIEEIEKTESAQEEQEEVVSLLENDLNLDSKEQEEEEEEKESKPLITSTRPRRRATRSRK